MNDQPTDQPEMTDNVIVPDAWNIDNEKLTILLAPQGTELPSGFPFTRVTADLRSALATILEAKAGDIIVLAVSEKVADVLIDLRAPLEFNALSLVGGDIDPVGLWSLILAPLQELAIQEIMKSRSATPSFSRPPSGEKLQKDDIKTFSRDVTALAKKGEAWDKGTADENNAEGNE